MSTAAIFYMIPQAIAQAASTLIGNYLGDNNPTNAKLILNISLIFDFIYGLFAGAFLTLILRPYWGNIYTNNTDVFALIYRALPVMFIYLSIDSPKCITLNILRSTGRPFITGYCIIISIIYHYFIIINYYNLL